MLQPCQPDHNTTGCPVPPPCHYKTSRPLERTGGQAQTGGAGIWKAQVLGLGVKATRGILNKNKQKKTPHHKKRAKQQFPQQKCSSRINEILITPLQKWNISILKCTKTKIFINILLRNFCCCFRVSIEIQCMKVAIATSKFLNNCFSSEQLQYHTETRVKWGSWKDSDQLQAPNQVTPRFSQTQLRNF